MPYNNLPKMMWPKMERCVTDVMKSGKDKQAAIAICYESLMGKKHGGDSTMKQFILPDDVTTPEITVKEEDGRYKITAISTAAVPDLEGETFDTSAMDYDIAAAKEQGDYPEFRLFHKKVLPIGKVTKMSRVGIFAIDEGYSYTDPFSLSVCKSMLIDNPGKWRVSKGFYVVEASGGCPSCGEKLLVRAKEMKVGFRCPTCKSIHPGYKGVLKDLHFRKARTFDVTITDHPCVPFTGVSASKEIISAMEESLMNKKQLKERLLAANVPVDVIDAKLETLDDAELKEYEDIPEAMLLKELDVTPAAPSDEELEGDVYVMDDSVLKAFAEQVEPIIEAKMKAMLDGLTIEVGDALEIEAKEIPGIDEILTQLKEIKETLATLTQADGERLKELNATSTRQGQLRVMRLKASPASAETEVEEEPESITSLVQKSRKAAKKDGVAVVDGDGNEFDNMTAFLRGGE
jgi:phage FluMu protein Com